MANTGQSRSQLAPANGAGSGPDASPALPVRRGKGPKMTDRQEYPEDDPRHHTIKLKSMLDDTRRHAREDVGQIEDPKAQALFETTAEVLTGLITASTTTNRSPKPHGGDSAVVSATRQQRQRHYASASRERTNPARWSQS